jgi:hypothetical protein
MNEQKSGRSIEVNGATLYYEDRGDGAALILIHGGLALPSAVQRRAGDLPIAEPRRTDARARSDPREHNSRLCAAVHPGLSRHRPNSSLAPVSPRRG